MANKSAKATAANATDIDQLQSLIESLIKEQRSLHQRVGALQRRNLKLEELNTLKDEFIAVASHQLRTPATGVKQYIGLLLEGYADPLTESQILFLKKAEESNNRQLRIIDDLLQVARIDSESFRLNMTKIELGKMLDEAVNTLRPGLALRKQTIEFNPPKKKIYVRGDLDRLGMIFENLIDNASNYSENDKKIIVTLRMQKNMALVEVKDEGVGINRRDFPKLFQKFSRIPNSLSVEVGGTGLGLYWANKVATLHGGSIKVRSQLDKGSTFTVTLPAQSR
jgi:signal transduction histidine kinase